MKKTLLFISILAGMTMTFTGCDANVNIEVPQTAYNTAAPAANSAVLSDNEGADKADTPAVTAVTAFTEAAVSEEVTAVTEVSAAEESKKEENTSSEGNEKTVFERAAALAAPGSPFEKGYIESGYREMMSRYYEVEFDGANIYSYKLKYGAVNLGTCWNLKKSEGTVHSLANNIKDESAADEYSRLLDYIDSRAGAGNYRIHDAYTEYYTDVYGPVDDEEVSGNGTHIDIVLNSELDKYINASDADKSKYVIRFEAEFNGGIKSEYEYYSMRKELEKNVVRSLKSHAPEYAYGVDECFYHDSNNVLTAVHTPFFSAEKYVLVNGSEHEYWLERRRNFTAVENGNDVPESAANVDISITVYCRPGTDEETVKSVPKEIFGITSKYGIGYINVDVLENDSDFERYDMSEGSIPEETVRTTGRYHFFNLPEDNWGVPGK